MTPDASMILLIVTLILLILGVVIFDQGSTRRRTATRRARMSYRTNAVPAWRRGVHAVVMRTPVGSSVDSRLRRAGIAVILAGDAILATLVASAAVYFLALQLVTSFVSFLLAIAVVYGAHRYLSTLVRKRAEKFADQLPDIARIMSNAAGAGMAIQNALALTTREMAEPAHSLLEHAVRQMDIGRTLADAMESLEERAPSREMAVLVSTLIIQQRTGGDVIEALREMSDNLEVRRDLRREVDTTMSGVRYTAYAVMGLGVAMLFVLEAISNGTLRRMTESLAGQIVLGISATLYVIGFAAMRRLSRVDV
ncbi:MAG: type II secretion system F family protein [Euzebya sp.]